MKTKMLALLVLLAVALVACADDDDPEITQGTASPPARSEEATEEEEATEAEETEGETTQAPETVETEAPAATTAEPTAEPTQEVAGFGDTLTFDDGMTATLFGFEAPIQVEFFDPEPGNVWLAVDVQVCAGGEEESFNTFYFIAGMPDNTRRTSGFGVKEPSLNSGNLQPGDCVRGWVSFEVPDGVPPAAILLEDFEHQGRWQFQ